MANAESMHAVRPAIRLAMTERKHAWWIGPLLTGAGLGAFVMYVTFRAFYNVGKRVGPEADVLKESCGTVIVVSLPSNSWSVGMGIARNAHFVRAGRSTRHPIEVGPTCPDMMGGIRVHPEIKPSDGVTSAIELD